jgi:hypothetical protein
MNGHHQPHHDPNNGIIRRLYRWLCGVILAFCSASLIQSNLLFRSVDHLRQTETALMQDFKQSYNGSGVGSGTVRSASSSTGNPASMTSSRRQDEPNNAYDGTLLSAETTAAAKKYVKVIEWNDRSHLKTFMTTYFHTNNLVCDLVPDSSAAGGGAYLLNVSFGCNDLFYNSGLGSGNYVAGFYAMRLAAKALSVQGRRIDVQILCPDADREQGDLILPWLMGYFPSFDATENSQVRLPEARLNDACNNIDSCPIGYMYPDVQTELRRMAVRMVGIPPPTHSTHGKVLEWLSDVAKQNDSSSYRLQLPIPSVEQLENQPPLYPDVQLDDAIIHFRCGDLMNSNHPRYGFLSFPSMASPIRPQVRSIGIVTQPFDDKGGESVQSRAGDDTSENRRRCRIVVADFVRYLTERFPSARVSVHNSPHDTIALTYARMILANQSIAGISTFGVFPAIASFGTGYIRRPDAKSRTNGWLLHPPLNKLVKNLELMVEPNFLRVRDVRKVWKLDNGEQEILNWFRGGLMPELNDA